MVLVDPTSKDVCRGGVIPNDVCVGTSTAASLDSTEIGTGVIYIIGVRNKMMSQVQNVTGRLAPMLTTPEA